MLQQRPLSTSLVSYFNSLPITIRGVGYDADAIVSDLISRIQSHVASNTVVIPILQTFNVLLQGGVLCDVASNSRGHDRSGIDRTHMHPTHFLLSNIA